MGIATFSHLNSQIITIFMLLIRIIYAGSKLGRQTKSNLFLQISRFNWFVSFPFYLLLHIQ